MQCIGFIRVSTNAKGSSKMKNTRRYIYITAIIALILITYVLAYNYFVTAFVNTGELTRVAINNTVAPSRDYVEILSAYGDNFIKDGGYVKDNVLYQQIKYNAKSDSFQLNLKSGSQLERTTGSLTGSGRVPDSGKEKAELNLALSYNEYFYKLYNKIPDITWLYYTSENRFINMYPWTSPAAFRYTDKLKTVKFYQAAIPQNDPLRRPVWTPVYLDEAGKGLMVSVSSPVYDGDTFLGVVSIDLTTKTLDSLVNGTYESYLIDDTGSVIAAGQKIQDSRGIKKFKDLAGISKRYAQEIMKVKPDTAQRVGTNYIYRYNLLEAPWTLIIISPVSTIIGKAILCTLPIIIICILLMLTLREAERRKKAEAQIRDIAITDSLTGLKNRYFLETVIGKEFSTSDRYDQNLSIIIFDLDHFKRVNDKWGHPIGDEVLKQIADVTGTIVRKSDILIRLGGEEFLILLPQTDITGAMETAEKIRIALESGRHQIAGQCTASFGVAEKVKEETFISLYQKADEALYVAKKSGRNRVVSYETIKNFPIASIYLKWNAEWNSGNKMVDEQHRELLEQANNLLFLLFSNAGREEIDRKLDTLLCDLSDHFADEEKLQLEIVYPDYLKHAEIHKGLVDKALGLKEGYKNETGKASALVSFLMDDVIVGHMLEEDTKFYPYITDAPVKQC